MARSAKTKTTAKASTPAKKATTATTTAKKATTKAAAPAKKAPVRKSMVSKKATAAKKMAAKKTTPEKTVAVAKSAAPKKKDFDAFKKTPIAMNFVKSNNGCWDHDKWLGFLSDLREKGYEINDKETEDQVGLLLEQKKEQFFAAQ